MAKKKSKKAKRTTDDLVEIRVPRGVIDEVDKLNAGTVESIVAAILGNHALFGITKVDIRAHGSDDVDPPEIEIQNKC